MPPILFNPGDRVVVKGPYVTRNFTGTVLYRIGDYCWVVFDKDLPDICLSFPRGCPQERWRKIMSTGLRHLTTEPVTKWFEKKVPNKL